MIAGEKVSLPPPQSWTAFQESDYGATLYYPSNWFSKAKKNNKFVIFTSLNDKAVLSFRTFFDPLRTGADETVSKLKAGVGAHRILKLKQGEMWYEAKLNGDTGVVPQGGTPPKMITFVRRVYSCKERVVSQISLTYPSSSAAQYEVMLKKMIRRFQQGVGSKTPIRECS
ncbi:MAG: hypothetical protein DHS20C07_15520 [Methyloligella sp.]|nr:MAG: hypothetical protein DHS20C07_15520 [Methyloligella sp.]